MALMEHIPASSAPQAASWCWTEMSPTNERRHTKFCRLFHFREPVPLRQPAPTTGLLHEKGLRLVKPLLLATVATLGLAAALPASATPTITVQVGPAPYTAPTSIPFTLDPLGTSSLAGYVGQSISPVGGETFSFQDPSANPPNWRIPCTPTSLSRSVLQTARRSIWLLRVVVRSPSTPPQTSFNLLGALGYRVRAKQPEFNFRGRRSRGKNTQHPGFPALRTV
jgi:hypothetical protein